MYKIQVIFAYVLLTHQGICEVTNLDINCQELLGSEANDTTLINQRISTGKNVNTETTYPPKDDECAKFLDAIMEFIDDGIRFLEGENKKDFKDPANKEMYVSNNGYKKIGIKAENDDKNYRYSKDDSSYVVNISSVAKSRGKRYILKSNRKSNRKSNMKSKKKPNMKSKKSNIKSSKKPNTKSKKNFNIKSSKKSNMKSNKKPAEQTSMQQAYEGEKKKKMNRYKKLIMQNMFLQTKLSDIQMITNPILLIKIVVMAIIALVIHSIRLFWDLG